MRTFPISKSVDSRKASPIPLADLINNKLPLVQSPDEISNSKALTKHLIDTLYLSNPSRLETKNSRYFSPRYHASITDSKAALINRITVAISEKLFDPISPTSMNKERMLF